MSMSGFDVLGLGCTTVDDVLYVPAYPPLDGKVRVEERRRQCGGLTGAALIAAARLGGRCGYAGRLGVDEQSMYVRSALTSAGIDTSHAPTSEESQVIHSTIIVGRDVGSRNIFFRADGKIGAHETLPPEAIIQGSTVLLIDHYGMVGNLRAVRIARAAGVAVVADLERETVPLFAEVLEYVDHLILSERFALRITGTSTPADAARALWTPNRVAVIVTCGEQGCWSMSMDRARQPERHTAFSVRAADSTGCGDVFHGAYALGLAKRMPLEDRIRFASAAAALKARDASTPGQVEVEEFLRR
jgi:sulfofructose kinase